MHKFIIRLTTVVLSTVLFFGSMSLTSSAETPDLDHQEMFLPLEPMKSEAIAILDTVAAAGLNAVFLQVRPLFTGTSVLILLTIMSY